MPHRVSRSDSRDDALDRYAAAAIAKATAGSNTIAQTTNSFDHAVVASRRQVVSIEIPQRVPTTAAVPQDDAETRDLRRRIMAGLPLHRPEPEPQPVPQVQPPSDDEILHTVEGLVPSVLAHRGRTMNRIAASMISDLIDSLDIDSGRKRWLVAQTKTGIVDPDIFMRDLRLSLK